MRSDARSRAGAPRWLPCRRSRRQAAPRAPPRRWRPEPARSPAAPNTGPVADRGRRQAAASATACRPCALFVVLARTLLGLGVVVAALERDPVGLGILADRKEVRPRITGHGPGGLRYHVELTVRSDLADV